MPQRGHGRFGSEYYCASANHLITAFLLEKAIKKVKTHDAQSSQVCCYNYGIFGCNSFEEHLSTVFAELKQFCARNSLQLHMMHLSRQLLGFTKSSEYPIGILGCSRIQTFFLTCYKCVFDFMFFLCDSADCPGIGSKVLTQFRS